MSIMFQASVICPLRMTPMVAPSSTVFFPVAGKPRWWPRWVPVARQRAATHRSLLVPDWLNVDRTGGIWQGLKPASFLRHYWPG